ncbi:MAG TPA: hypothetical protein VJC03_02085 [bacterium]|nr:hypothetical protein [bacterium]
MNEKESKIMESGFRISASFLSLAAVLVLAEVLLRLFGPEYYKFGNSSQEYYSNPRGYFIPLKREGRDILYGLNYTGTPEGYRTSDIPVYGQEETPSGRNTILGLGDSFTFGRGVKYEDIYLSRLEKMLGKEKVKVRNCATVGADMNSVIGTYLKESSGKKYPLVLYGFVLNDFGLPHKEKIVGLDFIDINNGGHTYLPLRKRSALLNFLFHVFEKRRLHRVTRQAYLNAFEGARGREGFKKLEYLDQSVKKTGGRLAVAVFPLLYDFREYPFKEIHEKIAFFCSERNIPCLDLLPAFSEQSAESLWAHPTDHHPNERAHKIAAEEIFKFLKEKTTDFFNG